jgi:hypothetical protein
MALASPFPADLLRSVRPKGPAGTATLFVMPGLVPGIHGFLQVEGVDGQA